MVLVYLVIRSVWEVWSLKLTKIISKIDLKRQTIGWHCLSMWRERGRERERERASRNMKHVTGQDCTCWRYVTVRTLPLMYNAPLGKQNQPITQLINITCIGWYIKPPSSDQMGRHFFTPVETWTFEVDQWQDWPLALKVMLKYSSSRQYLDCRAGSSQIWYLLNNVFFWDVTPCGFARTDVSEESIASNDSLVRTEVYCKSP
jgi:hypothetical protein